MGAYQEGAVLNDSHRRHLAFARLFGSAVLNQAILSAASFAVGLILLRNATAGQFGYYVLAINAILLLTSLQNAFFGPPLAMRLHRLERVERGQLVGGLYREQHRILSALGLLTILVALGLWYSGVLDDHSTPLVLITVVAALAVLHREYFRMVLLAYRRSHAVLGIDVLYVALLLAGIFAATLTPTPAIGAIGALGLAAIVGGTLLSRALRHYEPRSTGTVPNLLREIAPLAAWSTAGAAVHWAFSQGYIYLVAGTLDVTAVAAIAATRLLMMPVNLLSSGIGSLMLPVASGWLHKHGATLLLRRLYLLAAGLVVAALCYFLLLWLLRDWIFAAVLRKQFAQRDELLLLWGAIFLLIVIRDQLIYLPAAQGRFHALTLLTLFSATIALATSFWGILQFGLTGALVGMLIGELINVTGIMMMCRPAPLQRSNGITAPRSAVDRNSP